MTTKSLHPETIALHGGTYRKDESTNSVAVPIYQTTSGYNCFLIRHPAKVINSYIKKNNLLSIDDIGFKKQYEIFNMIKKDKIKYLVVNADTILQDPLKTLKKLCKILKIRFTKKMLSWPKGKRSSDGIWSTVWYNEPTAVPTIINAVGSVAK